MFRKKCSRCNKKISKKYDFCPFCGNSFKTRYDKEDYGFLGKNDSTEENLFSNEFRNPFFGGSLIDKIFNRAMKELPTMIKMLEKQMQESFEENDFKSEKFQKLPNNLRIQLFVNGKRITPNENQIKQIPLQTIAKTNKISDEKLEKFSKLPKKEPVSKIRRLSGKIIYEIEVPGVNNIEDILINQLENSIEIKALSKDKVYSKTLNINLPILGYKLSNENLILELRAGN